MTSYGGIIRIRFEHPLRRILKGRSLMTSSQPADTSSPVFIFSYYTTVSPSPQVFSFPAAKKLLHMLCRTMHMLRQTIRRLRSFSGICLGILLRRCIVEHQDRRAIDDVFVDFGHGFLRSVHTSVRAVYDILVAAEDGAP